jgi:opacity protein-like surface antigen
MPRGSINGRDVNSWLDGVGTVTSYFIYLEGTVRSSVRVTLALIVALVVSTSAFAQSDNRVSLKAAIGPSFSNIGTTYSALAGVDVRLNDRVALVGVFGATPHTPFQDAAEIAAPLSVVGSQPEHVNAYHWNGNIQVRPFQFRGLRPYVTGGLGSFIADALVSDTTVGGATVQDRRRTIDFATNVGAGVTYQLNDYVGVGADYRTFFVHRDGDTPRVNRLTAGLTFGFN